MSTDNNFVVSIKFRLIAESSTLYSRLEVLINYYIFLYYRNQNRLVLSSLRHTLTIFNQSWRVFLFCLGLLCSVIEGIGIIGGYKLAILVIEFGQ